VKIPVIEFLPLNWIYRSFSINTVPQYKLPCFARWPAGSLSVGCTEMCPSFLLVEFSSQTFGSNRMILTQWSQGPRVIVIAIYYNQTSSCIPPPFSVGHEGSKVMLHPTPPTHSDSRIHAFCLGAEVPIWVYVVRNRLPLL